MVFPPCAEPTTPATWWVPASITFMVRVECTFEIVLDVDHPIIPDPVPVVTVSVPSTLRLLILAELVTPKSPNLPVLVALKPVIL